MEQAVDYAFIMPDRLEVVWPRIKHYLQDAVEYDPSGASLQGSYDKVLKGEWLLALAHTSDQILAAFVLEIVILKKRKTCAIVLAGGVEMDKWLDGWMEVWKDIAREQNCQRIVVRGRPGWQRALKPHGFKPIVTILEAAL